VSLARLGEANRIQSDVALPPAGSSSLPVRDTFDDGHASWNTCLSTSQTPALTLASSSERSCPTSWPSSSQRTTSALPGGDAGPTLRSSSQLDVLPLEVAGARGNQTGDHEKGGQGAVWAVLKS
jgi:hypothetical protein